MISSGRHIATAAITQRGVRQGNGDALDDVRAGFTEEEELLVRRP